MSDLRELYAAVPVVACRGLCHDQCTVIPLARVERAAIEASTGRRVKTLPQVEPLTMRTADDGSCRYLKRGRCSIYEVRPMICRLYGAAEGLECSHGCRPIGSLLSRDTVAAILAKLDALPRSR